jgi:hypothetical protein
MDLPPEFRNRSDTTLIADFCICWLTLGGLVNVAVGLVSFKLDLPLSLFGVSLTTVVQRFIWIAVYLAIAICGLSYIGWRQSWHYGISGLLIITGWLCMVFAALIALRAHTQIVVVGVSISQLLYALAWTWYLGQVRKNGKNSKTSRQP